jgi:hypothetical protein
MLDALRGFGVEAEVKELAVGNNRYCRLHRAHPSKIAKGGAAITYFGRKVT